MLAVVFSALPRAAFAKPSILISPNRIVLDQKDRKATLYVSNNGDEKANYRIEFVRKRMTEDGRYEDVKEGDVLPGELWADDYLRVSPRSFTLGVGEGQIVRVHFRRKKGMPEGEYRAHLRGYIVPDPPAPDVGLEAEGKVSISVTVNFGMAIPVIARQGDLDYSVTVDDIDISKDEEGKYILKTKFLREGNRSAYGDISVVFTDDSGKEHLLKFLGGLSVFSPYKARIFTIPLDVPDGLTLKNGSVKVTYREKKKEGGKVIAEKSKQI